MGRLAKSLGRLAVGAAALAAVSFAHEPVIWDSDLAPPPALSLAQPTQQQRLSAAIDRLGAGFPGEVGIAVLDVERGWAVDYNGQAHLPQQSVSKLWVAITVLNAVDRGDFALSDTVLIRKEDLSVFHQPLRNRVGPDGYRVSIDRLLAGEIQQSDNAANDALIRKVGGPWAVQVAIVGKSLGDIRFGPGEREMQTAAAGLTWKPEYSFGRAFWDDREKLPPAERRAALQAYLANPPDAASALDIVETLARLQRGELLSARSTDHLLTLMAGTRTGATRLRAGLSPGWTLRHKTGTGQVMGALATGNNDVGLLTAPDGRVYAVAVMIGQSRAPFAARQALMQDVARAVIASHGAPAPPA
ncbi:MAG: serine hydrolase [Caulobacter sp.]|nr:serine hydrolase [Caulobacter sp.]